MEKYLGYLAPCLVHSKPSNVVVLLRLELIVLVIIRAGPLLSDLVCFHGDLEMGVWDMCPL